MDIRIENGSTYVRSITPGCLSVSVHADGRKIEATGRYNPAREAEHENGARDAYISARVEVEENGSEDARNSSEVTLFLSIPQAAAIVTALAGALAKHLDEDGHPIPYTPAL
jgi:ribosomal protein S16